MAEQYPTLRAGRKATGALLASMLPRTVRKVSDTARATSTPSADPELQISVEANAVYLFEGVFYAANVTATDDINIGWSAPAGADGTWGGIGPVQDATTLNTTVRILGTAIASGRNYGTGTGGASNPCQISVNGNLIVSTTAGTFSLSWSRAEGAGTTTLYQDSWLKLTRIA